VVAELGLPGGPVVGDVEAPYVEFMADSLLGETLGEGACT
jgi:hypothetical protein